MSKMIIYGGHQLSGTVTISGAKNSTVALIPASILSESPVRLTMVPDILDVHNLMLILNMMNVDAELVNQHITINPTKIKNAILKGKAVSSLRASYYFMGALLGRFGKAIVSLPGGDSFGSRPIDQHLKAFKSLGAKISQNNGCIKLTTNGQGLHGATVNLAMVSVGATINTLLAAVRAHGTTIIHNAAKEPEVIDVINFLKEMGAKIIGAGTHTVVIQGVKHLRAHRRHRIIPDRIEAGTYLSLAASVGKGINIKHIIPVQLKSFLMKLKQANVKMKINKNSIHIPNNQNIKPVNIITSPYPGFATDLQQPITPLLLRADGQSRIVDTIYPHRHQHVHQLAKMGANIKIHKDNSIIINSTPVLHGAHIRAGEIRAGACEVIAGLMAHGKTIISNADTILRGYDNIVTKLANLGAKIELAND